MPGNARKESSHFDYKDATGCLSGVVVAIDLTVMRLARSLRLMEERVDVINVVSPAIG